MTALEHEIASKSCHPRSLHTKVRSVSKYRESRFNLRLHMDNVRRFCRIKYVHCTETEMSCQTTKNYVLVPVTHGTNEKYVLGYISFLAPECSSHDEDRFHRAHTEIVVILQHADAVNDEHVQNDNST